MSHLDRDIAAFDAIRYDLERDHNGKWTVFFEGRQQGFFDNFETAAAYAVARFGRGPYLIRQIGAPPVTLPASVMYRPVYATS